MKNLFNFILTLSVFVSFAQATKVPIGEYKTAKTAGEKVNLILQENNRFSVSSFYGTYEQKNDSIYFKTNESELPDFKLNFETSKTKSDQLYLTFERTLLVYGEDKFIGIQETEKSEIEYKKIQDFVNYGAIELETDTNNYEKSINRCYAIYLIQENANAKSHIEKFIIPEIVSKIKIQYEENAYKNGNKLQGFYDLKTKTLSVGQNGKNILNFSFDNNEISKPEFEIPSDKKEVESWTYPNKIIDQESIKVSETGIAVDSAAAPYSPYSFQLKIAKSLKEAFSNNQNNKLKYKYLVVFNDLDDKNAEQLFKDSVKKYQSEVSEAMYDKYNPEIDNFDFYLTNKKDKSDFKKFGIADAPSISYYNSQGEKLYFSKDKIDANSLSYYNLINFNTELYVLDCNARVDKNLSAKKATSQQTIDVLYEITKQEVPYSDNIPQADFLPPVVDPEDEEKVVPKIEVKEIDVEYIAPLANDSIAVPAGADEYDYSQLKIKENKYKLKTTENQVNDKYLKILIAAQSDNLPNKKLVYLNLKELNNKGFSKILFKKDAVVNSKIHQLQMDYILKHYDSIAKFNEYKEGNINEFEKEYYTTSDLQYQVMQLLNLTVLKQNCSGKDDLKNAMIRYKKFVSLTKNDETVVSSYMTALKTNDFQNEYLTLYTDVFNAMIKDNSSVIEQLDQLFAVKSYEDYNLSWIGYKNNFANEANSAAWFVVEKVKDLGTIKKAIIWSETSLKIEKENHYYLDTLAQLYYKNGEKVKAIATEQTAIDYAIKAQEQIQIDEYQVVLEKMKNGSY